MYHCRFYHQVIREKHRHKEVGIDIGHHNSQLAPVGITQYIFYISGLCQIVQRKVNRIIHVTKLIHIAKSYLHRHGMPEFYILCHSLVN
ncbi:hypothetical protein IMSAGC004_01810 [Bacteroidaceae bacterium]|nr:hypothetical protein IMSAGC004_01810 [Bacteroidaceae bacterium]